LSCRVVYLTAYLTALVLFIAYSAIFISSLAVKRQDLPFSTFEDLLNEGTVRIGVRAKSSHEDYFKVKVKKVKVKAKCKGKR
jgi:hypothetical protein